jgi:DNA-directed RNA polymerase subunit beta
MFFDVNVFHVKKDGFSVDLIPGAYAGRRGHLRHRRQEGDKIIVEMGRRITARHVRLLEQSGLKRLDVPREYLIERVIAKDVVDASTGEILVPCNSQISEDVLEKLLKAGVKRSPRSTPTTSIAARTSPRRCASTPPATVWRRWSRSIA